MDFDFNISDDVPLWKTFDYLIETEKPKTVLDFLSMYSTKEMWDIFNKSTSLPSLFCFDKLISLDYPSIEKLAKIAHESIEGYYEPYMICDRFIESLLQNRYINPIVKKDLMKGFLLIPKRCRKLDNSNLLIFENELEEYIINDNIAYFLNNINKYIYPEIKYILHESVYYFRIIQKSVLENVNTDTLNYLVFDSIFTNNKIVSKNILFSNISSSVKMLYLFKLSTLLDRDKTPSKTSLKYYNMESAEEILMNLDLDSSVNIQLLLMEFIFSPHGRQMIRQIYDLDRDLLERNFPIGDLPEHKNFVEMKF